MDTTNTAQQAHKLEKERERGGEKTKMLSLQCVFAWACVLYFCRDSHQRRSGRSCGGRSFALCVCFKRLRVWVPWIMFADVYQWRKKREKNQPRGFLKRDADNYRSDNPAELCRTLCRTRVFTLSDTAGKQTEQIRSRRRRRRDPHRNFLPRSEKPLITKHTKIKK